MNVDLITRLIKAGAPPELIAEVAAELAKGEAANDAIEQRRAHERERKARARSREVTGHHVTERDIADNPDTPLSLSPNENNSNPHTHTPVNKPRARKDGFVLPPHIPPVEWAAYLEMRARIRKPMTPHAMGLAVKELDKLAADGWPPGAVLNHSTMNSYQGLFPPKDRNNGRSQNRHDPRSGASLLERLRADDAAAGLA